ncbi:hypothetical protein E2C01_084870 [Portunus trituberculatus]|uniref:Uncharacterized protein n=1 Tax=Portunus trituberculatus TaxID=210409 RepID=A0A5B7J8X0_PORTR|nr:hypothetical protein [Portunus trituberculatus]
MIFTHCINPIKRDWLPHVLQDIFMTKLSKYPHVQATRVTDGSVSGSRSRCRLLIRGYISTSHYTLTLRFLGGSAHVCN